MDFRRYRLVHAAGAIHVFFYAIYRIRFHNPNKNIHQVQNMIGYNSLAWLGYCFISATYNLQQTFSDFVPSSGNQIRLGMPCESSAVN